MASYSFSALPEVFGTTAQDRAFVAEGVRLGKIRRIRRGLYTTNLVEPLESLVRRNVWPVVAILCPGGVVSHRTALEARPTPGGMVAVTTGVERTLKVPGLTIRQFAGPTALEGDAAFIGGLSMSSRPRFLLECLSGKVYEGGESPYVSAAEVEAELERLLTRVGEDGLNEIRDRARSVAPELGMSQAQEKLDATIGALIGTRRQRMLSATGKARVLGDPYDADRIALFQTLLEELAAWSSTPRPNGAHQGSAFVHASFFDAYFSNFIEGTEFEVAEAVDIAIHNRIPLQRPEDAHDIAGTFKVVGSPALMQTRISALSSEEFVALVSGWHGIIMAQRLNTNPGHFKALPNRAGLTTFVHPDLVRGTLTRGFELGRVLGSPFARAAFFMFLISEVHPFVDGNGRLARAVANAELVSHGETRLIVPTVFRFEYLESLRSLTRHSKPRNYVRMADQAQEFTAEIIFDDLEAARRQLEAWNAFERDSDSRLRRPPR